MLTTRRCGINLDMSTLNTPVADRLSRVQLNAGFPIDRRRLAAVLWLTWLRCPDCESIIPKVLDDDAIYALDEVLDRGTYALTQNLETLALSANADRVAPRRRRRKSLWGLRWARPALCATRRQGR